MSLYIPNLATDEPVGFVQGLAGNFNLLEGSLVESGSNENGEYWRLENGLQICAREGRVSNASAFWSSRRDLLHGSLVHPSSFISPPYVAVSRIREDNRSRLRKVSFGTSSATNNLTTIRYALTNDTVGEEFLEGDFVDVFVVTIGRWK